MDSQKLTKMHHLAKTRLRLHFASLWVAQIAPILIILALSVSVAYGAELQPRGIFIANSSPGATTTYSIGFTLPGSETLGSIEVQFCSNSPLIGDPCNAPGGFSAASATLTSQTGP